MNIKQLDEALYDKYIAPTDRPVPNERYRMLYHYLHSYHRYKTEGSSIIFATVPLDEGEWIPFPMTQVIAFKDGKEVFRGKRHRGIFIPTIEYITALDAMHI